MLFEVGETVVYPHHGAATITEVKKRIIKGEEKLYLIRARRWLAADAPLPARLRLAELKDEPLILPTGPHGLRSTLESVRSESSSG